MERIPRAKELKRSLWGTGLALLFFSLWTTGCVKMPKDPRDELASRHIAYTEQNFINAVKKGDNEITEFFLDAGMNVDSRGETGIPALLLAAANGHPKTLELLLARGAFVNAIDKDGRTALMVAAERNDVTGIKILLKYKADTEMRLPPGGQTALLLATAEGKLYAVEALARGGAQLNARDNDGRTALFLTLDNTPIFQKLVKLGADVNVSYQGQSLYTYVKETGNIILIKTLESAGAQEPEGQL